MQFIDKLIIESKCLVPATTLEKTKQSHIKPKKQLKTETNKNTDTDKYQTPQNQEDGGSF